MSDRAIRADPEREEHVFGYRIDWLVASPMVKFEGLVPADARTLLDERYVGPDVRCGNSPPMAELVAFMERYDTDGVVETEEDISAHGRVVGPNQSDARVLFEGVKHLGLTSDEFVREFAALFYGAGIVHARKEPARELLVRPRAGGPRAFAGRRAPHYSGPIEGN